MKIFDEDDNAIEFVNEFEKRTRRFELNIDTVKASNIFPTENTLTTSRIYRKPPESLGTILASSLRYFRTLTDATLLGNQAILVKRWIDYAWDQGVISEGQGITGRLQDCEKEKKELEDQKTSLENELILVSKEYEKLEEINKTMEDELKIFHEKYGKPKL